MIKRTFKRICKNLGYQLAMMRLIWAKQSYGRLCENCGCELADNEEGWCDDCNLPERSPIQ